MGPRDPTSALQHPALGPRLERVWPWKFSCSPESSGKREPGASESDGWSSTQGLLTATANVAEFPPAGCSISIPQYSEGSAGITPTLQRGFQGTEDKHPAQGHLVLRDQSRRSAPGSLTPKWSPTASVLRQDTNPPPNPQPPTLTTTVTPKGGGGCDYLLIRDFS